MITSAQATIDWSALTRSLHPEDFLGHIEELRKAYRYAWVREAYGHSMSEAVALAEGLLGRDPKQRYGAWLRDLTEAHRELAALGVAGYAELCERLATREGVEAVLRGAGLSERELGGLVSFLRYWVIPQQRPLRAMVEPGAEDPGRFEPSVRFGFQAEGADLAQRQEAMNNYLEKELLRTKAFSVIFIYFTSVALGISAMIASVVGPITAFLSVFQGVMIFAIIGVLIVMGKRRHEDKQER